MNSIPKDTILMLSGVSCVGKTTTAYEIVKNYPVFRRVSELDMIRAIVRTAYEHFATEEFSDVEKVLTKYNSLFHSITNSDFETTKSQSKQLLPYMKEIILRQQRRRIPTILEGAAVIPGVFFLDNQPLEWLTEHVVFVNMYLPDETEHIARRLLRSATRDYGESIQETERIIWSARTDKQLLLHTETSALSQTFGNVFSLDISGSSPADVADTIMNLIFCYYDKSDA